MNYRKSLKVRALEQNSNDEIQIELAPGVSMSFMRIPAGPFTMGSHSDDKDARKNEKPQHEVHLDEYWMGKTPVTNLQYQVCVNASGVKPPRYWKGGQVPEGKEDHPVVRVSWHDAVRFCEWLSNSTGQSIRLPREAQWEKAARGTDARTYPWGSQKPDKSLSNYDSKNTTEVGKYSPQGDSPYGCVDMAGNVLEWVADWYDAYPGNTDSNEYYGTTYRVLRGGSWLNYGDYYLRSALRVWFSPDDSLYDFVGFRCVRSLH